MPKLPEWSTSFKSKFASKKDEDLKYEWNKLFVEMKTLELVKEEAARMQVIDHLEATDAAKYRPKMIGYGGF